MNIIKNAMTAEEIAGFQEFYSKHIVTADLLEEDGNTRIIVKGRWTPTGCAREFANCYIIARYSSYDRLDKKTGKVEKDVEDRA